MISLQATRHEGARPGELARVIESLSPSGRRAWRAASRRDFDICVEQTKQGYSSFPHRGTLLARYFFPC